MLPNGLDQTLDVSQLDSGRQHGMAVVVTAVDQQ
jgi:hypothetical protein